MSLLSSPRLEAVRLIREQLRCTLCGNMFQDPQCLDCKHNFCRNCILLHLKRNNTQCPKCKLPTRPSEVTRNQFLESILAAWKGVEAELQSLQDVTLHARQFTVQDTDRALHGAASGAAAAAEDGEQERSSSRGRVGNHKWHIDTQGIRQELKLEQPYLPQHHGRRAGSTDHWKKTSSSDLPGDYGGSARREEKPPAAAVTEQRIHSEEEKEEEVGVAPPQPDSLMATQEVESYLDRITKQREALSQWERNCDGDNGGSSSLLELERSLHNSAGFDELVKERRRESLQHDEDGDCLTQMPPSTSALESPDLLASFRRQNHSGKSENHNERGIGLKAKRRVLLASPPPLHPRGRMLSHSRKRLRMPSFQADYLATNGHNSTAAIDLSQNDSDDDNDEVPDSQLATMISDNDDEEKEEEEKEEEENISDEEEYKPSDEEEDKHDEDEEEEEEEYEMKPAVPLAPEPRCPPPTQHCARLRELFAIKKERVSDDFRSAVTAFQSDQKNGRDSARRLTNAVQPTAEAARPSTFGGSSKPPMHTSNGSTRTAITSEGSSFVFVSSDLNRDEVKRVLEATHRLGGKFGHDFDLKQDPASGHFCTSVTHLVTKAVPPIGSINGASAGELRCKRTAKYMRALAEGTFVVDFTWITASLAAGRWLTEEPFEMIGDIYSDAVGKPCEGRIRREQTGRRNSIFNMFCFVLLVSEKEFDFQFASVRALVNNFGGSVVHADNFAKLSRKQRARRTPIGVVSKTTSPWDAKAKWHQFQVPIVRITWIFDSVSHLEVLPFDDYYPY